MCHVTFEWKKKTIKKLSMKDITIIPLMISDVIDFWFVSWITRSFFDLKSVKTVESNKRNGFLFVNVDKLPVVSTVLSIIQCDYSQQSKSKSEMEQKTIMMFLLVSAMKSPIVAYKTEVCWFVHEKLPTAF